MNNSKTYVVEVGETSLTIETGLLAMQAGGAVTVRLGDSVVLCTATASRKPREGIDFFPLTVDYEEKLYAAGNVVIHDWGAQCILKERPETVHVFLQQDRDAKIEAAMQRLGVEFTAARSVVDEQDRNNQQYIRQFFNADWKDPRLYTMIIDMQTSSVEKAVQIVVTHVKQLPADN